MSETVVEPVESIDQKAKKAVLNMNTKLREQGFNERERAFMWGMTVSELRVFLNTIWEHMHEDKSGQNVGEEKPVTDEQLDKMHGPGAAATIDAAVADGSIFSENNPKPVPKPPKNKLGTDE